MSARSQQRDFLYRACHDSIAVMEIALIGVIIILVALLIRAGVVSGRRLRENQELRRVIAQLRVDRIIGDGYSYNSDYQSVTFVHQTPGRTEKLMVSIADIKTVPVDGVAHSKLW